MKIARVAAGLVALGFLLVGCTTGDVATTKTDTAPAELIARAELFGNPEKAAVNISPDGKQISYLAPVDGVLNVWVGPIDDPAAAKPVTNDTDRGIRRYFWAYTNEHIVYLQDIGGDENWRAYSANLDTGEIKDLTPFDEVQVRIQQVSHKLPNEILVAINNRNPQLHDIHLLNIDTGEMKLVEENPGYVGYVSDDEYNVRLAMQMTPGGGMRFDRKTRLGEWNEWLSVHKDDTLTTQPVGFDKTGEVVYMIDSRDRNTAALVAHDLGTDERKIIYENSRADVDNAIVHPTEYTVQAASSTFTRREWAILDDDIKGDIDYLNGVAEGELDVIDRTLDDSQWIVGYDLADGPYKYYRYDRKAHKAEFLFTSRPELEDEAMAKMHPVVIPARDGLELVSYLTLPTHTDPDGDGRPDEPLSMVLFVHGGPWARDNWGYHPYHQWLANRGFAVLSVNYRGSTGMGKDFINAADMEWAGKMHDDLIDAVEWSVTEGIADRDKVAIMGGSYGGYATLVGLTFTPDTFACGVDIVGPSNLVTLIEAIPPYWKPMLDLFTARVGDPSTEVGHTMLLERSPISRVDQITKPLLIGQGANDPRVKQQESDQIVQAMQAKEIPVTYALFPDEGHGFARPENRLAFNAVAEAFLGNCLGGRVEPIGDGFEGSSITVPAGAEQVAGVSEKIVGDSASVQTEAAPAGT